jgi:hypothetical protein
MRRFWVFMAILFTFGCGVDEPVADPGLDQVVATGSLVQLDGSQSERRDCNTSLHYWWHMDSKPEGSQAVLSNSGTQNPTFVADVDGLYVISLVVDCFSMGSGGYFSSLSQVRVTAIPDVKESKEGQVSTMTLRTR